jgi:hypothetical protein
LGLVELAADLAQPQAAQLAWLFAHRGRPGVGLAAEQMSGSAQGEPMTPLSGESNIQLPRRPVKTEHHLAKALHPTPSVLKEAMSHAEGFNAKFAVLITRLVGTMWCAYLFAIIALLGLGPALKPGGEGLIAWIAQTFLQLVLLSVIMVGQTVQSLAADARATNTFKDAEVILDRLDVRTQGGLKTILDRLDELAPVEPGGQDPPAASAESRQT